MSDNELFENVFLDSILLKVAQRMVTILGERHGYANKGLENNNSATSETLRTNNHEDVGQNVGEHMNIQSSLYPLQQVAAGEAMGELSYIPVNQFTGQSNFQQIQGQQPYFQYYQPAIGQQNQGFVPTTSASSVSCSQTNLQQNRKRTAALSVENATQKFWKAVKRSIDREDNQPTEFDKEGKTTNVE